MTLMTENLHRCFLRNQILLYYTALLVAEVAWLLVFKLIQYILYYNVAGHSKMLLLLVYYLYYSVQ